MHLGFVPSSMVHLGFVPSLSQVSHGSTGWDKWGLDIRRQHWTCMSTEESCAASLSNLDDIRASIEPYPDTRYGPLRLVEGGAGQRWQILTCPETIALVQEDGR